MIPPAWRMQTTPTVRFVSGGTLTTEALTCFSLFGFRPKIQAILRIEQDGR
jgi:hypothetical protein